MNFFKNNWFRLIVVVAILIIALSVGYYFLVYLPKLNASQELSKNIENCSQLESKVYKSYVDFIYHGTIISGNSVSSENNYNQNLKKCFVEITDDTTYGAPASETTHTNIYDGEKDTAVAQDITNFNGSTHTYSDNWSEDDPTAIGGLLTGTEASTCNFACIKVKYMGNIY